VESINEDAGECPSAADNDGGGAGAAAEFTDCCFSVMRVSLVCENEEIDREKQKKVFKKPKPKLLAHLSEGLVHIGRDRSSIKLQNPFINPVMIHRLRISIFEFWLFFNFQSTTSTPIATRIFSITASCIV